jgi:hypothetical protein
MVRKIAPSPRKRPPGSSNLRPPSRSEGSFSSRLQSGMRGLLGSSQTLYDPPSRSDSLASVTRN